MRFFLFIISLIIITSCGHVEHGSENVTYYIDICPSCDCQIIKWGGTSTTLACVDSIGHLIEIEVLNHQVKEHK